MTLTDVVRNWIVLDQESALESWKQACQIAAMSGQKAPSKDRFFIMDRYPWQTSTSASN